MRPLNRKGVRNYKGRKLSLAERRDRVKRDLSFKESSYRATENPIHAWDAITECLAVGLELPDWTRSYLYQAGGAISRLGRQNPPPAEGKINAAVTRALGLLDAAQADHDLAEVLEAARIRDVQDVGNALRELRGRTFDGVTLERDGRKWLLVSTSDT